MEIHFGLEICGINNPDNLYAVFATEYKCRDYRQAISDQILF